MRAAAGVQLVVLGVISVLLSAMELMFQFTYVGPVPLPLGTIAIVVSMPWLVRATVEAWPSAVGAAAPVVAWFLVTAVVGAWGPGGDSLLLPVWQTFLLLATGVLVGLFSYRRAVDRLAADRAAGVSS